MKKIKIKRLSLLIVFSTMLCLSSFGQLTMFQAQDYAPFCAGETMKFKIENIWDFFDGYNNNGYTKYLKLTTVGPASPQSTSMIPVSSLIQSDNSVTVQFNLLNHTDWFNPEIAYFTIQGFQSNNGSNYLGLPPCVFTSDVPVANNWPGNMSGPSVINSPNSVQYSLPYINTTATFTWSLPSGWTILSTSNQGKTITVQPSSTNGEVSVTSSPPLYACNKEKAIDVTVTDCYAIGVTNHDYCDIAWGASNLYRGTYADRNVYPITTGDFNGDGNEDVIAFQNKVYVSTNPIAGKQVWSNAFVGSWITQETYPRMVGDFSGDGKDDIIIFEATHSIVGVSDNNTFNISLFNPFPGFSWTNGYTDRNVVQRMIGDFNGDNKDDIVGFGYSSHSVALSDGTSFSTANFMGGPELSANSPSGFCDMNKYPKMVGDFNGDGLDDVIGFGQNTVQVGISDGTQFNFGVWSNQLTHAQGFLQRGAPRMIGDFNGDGMDDVIGFNLDGDKVIVGISTGTSFTVSPWMYNYFSDVQNWQTDGREIGVGNVPINSSTAFERITVADANGDGLDDIIGIKDDKLAISYSNGWLFLCPAWSPSSYIFNTLDEHSPRLIANFDASDDAVEMIAYSWFSGNFQATGQYNYMNCISCDKPVANAEAINYNAEHSEIGLEGEFTVYDYCNDNVEIDASASSCFHTYFYEIQEFNLSTHTGNVVYNSGWLSGQPSSNIDISSLYNLQPNQLYSVVFGVGYSLDTDQFFVRLKNENQPPIGNWDLTNSNESRFVDQRNGPSTIVHSLCEYHENIRIDANESFCYDKYRFEVYEVNTSFNPVGSPIAQIPANGAWTFSQMPNYIYIPTTGMIMGAFYRVQMFLENDNGTVIKTWFVDLKDCVPGNTPIRTRKQGLEEELNQEYLASHIYPNPTSSGEINIKLQDYSSSRVTATIYSLTGEKIKTVDLVTEGENSLGVNELPSGTYFIRVIDENKVETLRFVKAN